jgi:DNA polymerase III subunit gamma/tau
MYQVIARKYRPQHFGELVGQEHVRTTLANAISQNRIAHGYIFSGQRGTGKTTVARILARCLNCVDGPTGTPCGQCASCLEISGGNTVDVIEIDAASNRGINEMRELRENVRYRPARDRYKVFIVDEAHQITSEAFNALLKTLEEPPEWVVFILCTTESHKIPTTIASRCQQFSFRSVDFEELVTRMQWICEQEGIQADSEVLSVLAHAGEGSVRDSLSALDQAIACCGDTLNPTEVRRLLGTFSLDSLGSVAEALKNSDRPAMLGIVGELERNGHDLQHFCRELSRYFRNLLVVRIAGKNSRLVAASAEEQEQMVRVAESFSETDLTRYLQITLDLFKDLQTSLQPRLHLELGLLRLVEAAKLVSIEEAISMLGSGAVPAPGPAKAVPTRSASVSGTAPPSPAAAPAPVRTGPSPFARDTARKTPGPVAQGAVAVVTAVAPQAEPVADPNQADWRKMLHEALTEAGHTTTADAVEHSAITFTGAELVFTSSRIYGMAVKGDSELPRIVQRLAGRPVRITIKQGEAATSAAPLATATAADTDLEQRALSHPEVQRFRELFPDAQVRDVRNLKD